MDIQYQRIDPGMFESCRGFEFQMVADHVQDLLGNDWHPLTNIDLLTGTPDAVKFVWYAWYFGAEVGGNGLFDYFINSSFNTVQSIQTDYYSIKQIGATKIVDLLEASFPLLKHYESEINELPGVEWFDSFSENSKWPDLESLQQVSMELAGDYLHSLGCAYVKAHRYEI